MSGILDSKSRIMDMILTQEGRRQMAESTFRVSYVTFTDESVAYLPDAENGHEDPTTKIYLEACNLPQDQITFEANDEGKLNPLRNQNIYIKSPGLNVSASFTLGTIKDGKLYAQERFHGRRIQCSDFFQNSADDNKGFIYSDISGVTGSVLLKSNISDYSIQSPAGGPHIAYIGTKSNPNQFEISRNISAAINQIRAIGGGRPQVVASSQNNIIFLDAGVDILGNKQQLYYVGNLSSSGSFILEESAIGGKIITDEVQNANFASQITGILTSSFDNFLELGTIATIDRLFLDDKFELSQNNLNFSLGKIKGTAREILNISPPSINSLDSLFNDSKLSHLENFMYLPPIVKVDDSVVRDKTNIENLKPYLLGDYPSLGDNEKKLTFTSLMKELSDYEYQTVHIEKTSIKNNVFAQFFEVSNSSVQKLDVVDFGKIRNEMSGENDYKHVYFIGKVFLDNKGTACFVNMFTLIIDKIPEVT